MIKIDSKIITKLAKHLISIYDKKNNHTKVEDIITISNQLDVIEDVLCVIDDDLLDIVYEKMQTIREVQQKEIELKEHCNICKHKNP